MKHVVVVILTYILIFVSSAGGASAMGPFEEQPWRLPDEPQVFASWAEVFENAPRLTLRKVLTGYVEAGPDILINPKDPKTPDEYQNQIWVPSPAYVVEHPKYGAFALDTGVKAGECSYGTRPLYWVPCKSLPGSDITTYVKEHEIELKGVIASHFHGDHISGLSDLLAHSPVDVLASGAEIKALKALLPVRFGYETAMFDRPMTLRAIDEARVPMPHLGDVANLFGDGSLWLISTPGHTRGHISALLVSTTGPVLLTFDISHLKAGFDNAIRPGFVTSGREAEESLQKLRELTEANPEIDIIYGHEPSQWEPMGEDAAE